MVRWIPTYLKCKDLGVTNRRNAKSKMIVKNGTGSFELETPREIESQSCNATELLPLFADSLQQLKNGWVLISQFRYELTRPLCEKITS